MRDHLYLFSSAFLCVTAVSLLSVPADACTPPSPHDVKVKSDSSPECISLSGSGFYVDDTGDGKTQWDRGALQLTNNCEQTVVFEALDCESCGDRVELVSGDSGYFVLENRPLEAGDVTTQTVGWSLDSDEGVIETRVQVTDTSGACSDWPAEDEGCQTAHAEDPVSSLFFFLLVAATIFLGLGRRQNGPPIAN